MVAFVPRWVRVNTLKIMFEEFIRKLDSLSLIPVLDLDSLKDNKNAYVVDTNITNLLAFHPSYPVATTFSSEYTSGIIILQDKASCIPADLLNVPLGSKVFDACAAPGNKTTQLVAAIGPTGNVFAVEKDSKRAETLKNMVEKAGALACTTQMFFAKLVTTILNADFTTLNPSDKRFTDITHILLDPSCSGSGLDRLDYNPTESDLSTRLRNLSIFQTRLLKHALSFPSVEKVVYSTCSHHVEENERVVMTILNEIQSWRVLKRDEQPDKLKIWHRRGISQECVSEDIAEGCIRCEKGIDGTIGFFAVAFVRDTTASPKREQILEEQEEWQGIP